MGVAAEDGRIDSVLTADGEPSATIFAMSKHDADRLMKYWRERDLVILDVDNNRKVLRLQREPAFYHAAWCKYQVSTNRCAHPI